MASSCTSYEPNCGSTSLCDQNCGCTAAHRQTDGRTDGLTNLGDLIGPNPTKVGGPKSKKSNGGK